jgi:hypothetical protein
MSCLVCYAIVIACACGCSGVKRDEDFSRNFIIRLRAGDPSVESDMNSTLLALAGSWQSLRKTISARFPTEPIDSIVFVSKGRSSSLPKSVRMLTLNVFGGRQFSTVELYLETGNKGQPILNTIRATGPESLP